MKMIKRLLFFQEKRKKINYLLEDYIPCIYIPYKNSRSYMIYSHGNACDLGDMCDELINYSERFQTNIFAYEYQGYGVSKGKTTSDNVKKDITIVYDYITQILMVPPKNIIIFGRSIGTGPSLYLAGIVEEIEPNSLGGLIIQSPYTSIRDIAKAMVGSIISLLVGKMFDNIGCITKVFCPTLVIHGVEDNVIPCQMGQDVFDASPAKEKRLILCEGSDHNVWDYESDIYIPISKFYSHVNENLDNDQIIMDVQEKIFFSNITEIVDDEKEN